MLAELGPTNTGKTFHAVERMLAHDSGMIGLPLRLLAREVYDRISARVGEAQTALVTGEERRIPPRPRWWVCTVEAMPEAPVDCLVVDEVQLAADRGRGHVFTDRLLHARGRLQTVFCGARTIEPVLRRLVPEVQTEERPRLSRLRYTGHRRLGALPPRTAIVAFTAEEVYALAERVRRRHGGAAVVLGALSPRARNAQAAMFSSGEVPFLVATDAIGMGLNLEIEHVAFATTRKFDGFELRRLRPAELAQIAGRAGRFRQDGSFGVTGEEPELAPRVVEQIETHDFPPLKAVQWRASQLDWSSVGALLHALRRPPPHGALLRTAPDEDEIALDALARSPDVRARTGGEAGVRLLWEVCRIPDYRKEPAVHAELLRRIFLRLADHGRLAAGWLLAEVDKLDRVDGEIDQLSTRLLHVRTWSFVAQKPAWVEEAAAVAARAREVEDRLSDQLHQQLTERFVDRRAQSVVMPGAEVEGDAVRVGGRRVGELRGLQFLSDEAGEPPKAVLAAVAEQVGARAAALLEAPEPGFSLDDGQVSWRGGALAKLAPGPKPTEPAVRLVRLVGLPPGQGQRLQRRVEAWLRDEVGRIFAPLRVEARGAVRGVLFALEEGLGLARVAELPDLSAAERRQLGALGVRFGLEWAWALPLLDHPLPRARLYAAWAQEPLPPLPTEAVAPRGPASEGLLRAAGRIVAGPLAIRVDRWEALQAGLRAAARRGPVATPELLASFAEADAAMRALGWVPGAAGWERRRR